MNEVDELAKALAKPDGEILRQGIVTDVDAPLISVKWGNSSTETPGQRYLASYSPTDGDTVWGIRDGDVTLVLGKVAT